MQQCNLSVRRFVALGFAAAMCWCVSARAQTPAAELRGQVLDEDSQPVARVQVVDAGAVAGAEPLYTDVTGHFEIDYPRTGMAVLSFSKPGFFRIDDRQIELMPGVNDVTITLNHETELEQGIEVRSSSTQIDPETTSHQESLVQRDIVSIPVAATHDLQQSITTMPQALTDSGGVMHIAGARQGQTEVLLDGFEVNDPATGAFNSQINVDAVQDISVETGGYGAEYAHAGAGILAIDTASGDDKFRMNATNFVPGINLQEGIQLGNWDPRATFSGPLWKGKVWFSEAATGERSFQLVTELPRGKNTEILWGGDNLFRLQANLSPRNTLQTSFLFNRSEDDHVGLGPNSPVATTTDLNSVRYFTSAKDQLWVGHTLFSFGAAFDTGTQHSTPHGDAIYVVTPSNTSGNYFQTSTRQSRRLQGLGSVATDALPWHGQHTLAAGWNVAGLSFSQNSARDEIEYVRSDGTLSDRATFLGSGGTRLSNTQVGGYLEDHWRPVKPLVFTAGVRVDWDRLIHRSLPQPRLAMNWVPAKDGRMKFTAAWGVHYQPLNLLILSQGLDQQRNDLFYDGTGTIPLLPATVTTFQVPLRSLLQPRSYNTMAEWDDQVGSATFAGASFLLREGRSGFAYQLTAPPSTFQLENNRKDRYVAGEVWLRHAFNANTEFKIDYTRSSATSSQVLDPTLANLFIASQGAGPVLWDSPNRIVSTGWTPIPVWGELFLSGFFEYHTGFPFSSIDEQQQLIGAPNGKRFPAYVSLDLGVEKRFRFQRHVWAIRVSGANITAHNNPTTVVNNVDAPNYGAFTGGHTLQFSARLRLITAP